MVAGVSGTLLNHYRVMILEKKKISHELALTPSLLSSGRQCLFHLPTSHNPRAMASPFTPPVSSPRQSCWTCAHTVLFYLPSFQCLPREQNPACLFSPLTLLLYEQSLIPFPIPTQYLSVYSIALVHRNGLQIIFSIVNFI